MHVGAAELLVLASSPVAIFTSGGPPRNTFGLLVYDDGVVAQPGDVGTAGGGVAKDQGDGGYAGADNAVRSLKSARPNTKRSAWLGRSAPPDSTRLMTGRRFSSAISRPEASC